MIGRSIAIPVAAIVLALLADHFLNDSRATLFLLRKFADMVEYVSIWR